ncbi:phage tail protein [Leuconostoc mesenteroides]|uniref:phage tail protein n=1 Tax=Leuconostoc mesenteroides TaxID=1245 RepID=UPI002073A9B6|nr:phage tail protein [Leuconostoc mesenteroides]MCM6835953.1 phage tail protein [Leuconostoc mesenteroides]
MITFKNITGNKFLAVGTIQRKSALNGEKSLTGTLYDGDDVLNKIDKGWSLEFDNEPYIVTYFERNDNDNSVSFDAIHKFFWDMAKNVLYSETSGSHTIKWYLDQIFADAGYTYALNFNPNAIAKDNWGMKNKLSLFNDIITSIEGEFEINGTLVSIFKNIGTDLSTIVRYGFNLSDMTIENDASGFVTYGEGFGAYADQENMTGDRLHVTYTSPLASVYGKLQAEPIDDQRYTIKSNLLDAVKSQVDGSFSISVNLSLYDLSVAGYPYKMANVGDWLTAVDENLDFKQRIRIISIDDEFAADGTRISYSVTAGDIGLTKKYQDANASIANKVEDAVISAGQAATDANIALIAANGKNKSYYLNDINDLPKTANEGDLAWVQSGDGRVLYIYTEKADGTYYWEKRIDPEMGEQIEAGVNEAIAQANENTVTAIEQNNISQKEVMNDIAKSQADLAIKDGDFNNKAQAMADKALQDAKDNTATVAKDTLDTANQNIADAKTALSSDLQKEVSNRTAAVSALDIKAQGYVNDAKNSISKDITKEIKDRQDQVSALDTKAQGYADTAKQNAIDAATTADGKINKKIDDTASSLTSTISQNKSEANGKISTAQSTATQALNGLSTKVEKTEYDKKTGDLTTQLNTTTTTANQSKQDIVSINQKDGQQDSRMNTIESDASGTKQTVSQLQTVQGQQSGSISTLQQRADGFDATVTKVNNLSTGDRNYILDTGNPKTQTSNGKDNQDFFNSALLYEPLKNWGVANADYIISFDWSLKDVLFSNMTIGVFFNQSPWQSNYKTIPANQKNGHIEINFKLWAQMLVADKDVTGITFRINSQMASGNQITYSNLFMKSGNVSNTWTPAPEDGEQATAKAQLTADTARTEISNYKTDADGRISKAQSDITQTTSQVATKVSQSDYNAKTSELTTNVNNVTQTANQSKQDIVAIKQKDGDQDSRMTTIESDTNGVKTTVSAIQTKQGQQSGDISTLQQRADGFDATVTKVNNLAVGGRNYLMGTINKNSTVGANANNQSKALYKITLSSLDALYKEFKKTSDYYTLIFDWEFTGTNPSGQFIPQWNIAPFGIGGKYTVISSDNTSGTVILTANINSNWSGVSSVPYMGIRFDNVPTTGTVNIYNMRLMSGNLVYPWTQAPEDIDRATAKAQLTADQATTSLNAYKTDADGRISKAQSDIIQTAKDVTTKVSQSDYNAKTGQLSTDVSNAQQTANSAVTTIGSYKTSNDNRVAAAETKISQNANDITLRATTSDLNAAKSDYTAQIAQIKVDAQAVTTTVTQVQTTVNKLNQNNLVNNSQFNPDYSGWHVGSPWGKSATNELWNNGVETSTGAMWVWHDQSKSGDWIYSDPIAVYAGLKVSAAITAAMPSPPSSGTPLALYIRTYDANRNTVDSWGYNIPNGQLSGTFKKFSNDNRTLTTGVKYVSLCLAWNVSGQISFGKPMLMFGATTGDYVAGPYNNNDKVAAQQITIDGITNTVTQQGKNINSVTSRVQTAEGNISTATDNISGLQSKQTQTANQITQEITDRTKGDSNTLQSSKDFTQSSITSAVNGLNSTISQTANGILAQVESTNMVVNSEFDPLNGTFYRLTNGGSTGSQLAEAWSATKATGFADWPVVNGSRVVSYAVGTWYSSALVSTSAGKAFSASIVAGRSPAPTVSTALDYRIGFWDSSRKLLTTASAGNIIDGTAYKGIQKYVVENKTAPANTAFVSVIIAHSSANATDYITRPSLNTGAKASPYTPTYGTSSSSTVLSLFKDNWSIGITDNISKITSGIVGNASQMSLISKNVTIDSPNTQIKGTAWIQSAMIANGAIGSAQIGDATITSAKIAQLDVAKLTGNVSSFIQSNWNGVYGSTAITSSGMTVTSPGTVALFNVNGMTLDGAGGMTRVANGFTQIYSATHENVGMIGHQKDKQHTNVDYIMFGLNGYRTTNEGDSHWVGGSDFYGGDGMGFGVSNKSGGYDLKLRWDSDLIAGYKGELQGWHASDQFIFDNKTFHKGYADFSGGVTLSGAYAEGTRSLHTQGMSISTGAKWFGFMDGSNSTGFGTDQTQDVLFYVKGQVYSLYTMLGKLGMR